MQIIDGKKIANEILADLKTKIQKETAKPALAVILASNDSGSDIYVNSKQKKSAEIGINSKVYKFDKTVKEDEILSLISKLNEDNSINAILVQLPLYEHLDKNKIIEKVNPLKDVDGFHPYNTGRLFSNSTPYAIPCTPKGIIKLFKAYNINLEGKNIVIIGRSNIVGKPLSALLINENATVTVAHSKTKNLKEITKKADIVISATGQKKLIQEDMINENSILIDVGISRDENNTITGDVDFSNVQNKVSYITPVPGGVGPMTIACLMENTYELFKLQNGKI